MYPNMGYHNREDFDEEQPELQFEDHLSQSDMHSQESVDELEENRPQSKLERRQQLYERDTRYTDLTRQTRAPNQGSFISLGDSWRIFLMKNII